MKNNNIDINVDFNELAKLTEGYTNSDIMSICQDAVFEPIRKKIKGETNFVDKESLKTMELTVMMEDIIKAIKNIIKSMSQEDYEKFETFKNEYGDNNCNKKVE